MAIMHLSVKSGAKGKGAAHGRYIERKGEYSNRLDIAFSESGNMPIWASTSNDFWGAADEYERSNGRAYTELEISLPRELSVEQQIELVREFTNNVLGDSHAYTWAIHTPKAQDGEQNAHVHLMFTERTNDGIERNKAQFFKRYNPVNPEIGGAKKDRLFSHKTFVNSVREEWSITVNHTLEKFGIDARIDHRSYKELGIDLESQNVKRIFANSKNIDSASVYSLSDSIREKQRINGERIIERPDIALKALTSTSSTFTKRDLQKFIFSHTDGEEQYIEAYNRVLGSIQIQYLNDIKNVYTTDEMLTVERNLFETVERSNSISQSITFSQRIAFTSAFKAMEKRSKDRGKIVEPEQKRAFEILTSDAQIAVVNGAAGTGKSFVLQGVREGYERAGFNVIGTAIQGVTAQSMERDAGIQSRTVASLLSRLSWEEQNNIASNKSVFSKNTILIIDEAGMIGSKDMNDLLRFAEKTNTKVRMVGDTYQLSAVSAGNAFTKVQQALKADAQANLNTIIRQNNQEHRKASIAMSKHDIATGLTIHDELGNIQEYSTQAEARNRVVAQWAKSERSKIMLAYTNADVNAMNKFARLIMRKQGRLQGDDFEISTIKGKIMMAQGDEVIFSEANKDLGVLNGTRGHVESVLLDKNGVASGLSIQVDGKRVEVDLSHYNAINHGYASTIHKSQGVTVDDAFVLASSYMNANLTYVANTRHRENLTFVYSIEQFKNKDELIRTLSKKEEKTYSADFDVIYELKNVQTSITERETLAGRSLYTKRENPMTLPIKERIRTINKPAKSVKKTRTH